MRRTLGGLDNDNLALAVQPANLPTTSPDCRGVTERNAVEAERRETGFLVAFKGVHTPMTGADQGRGMPRTEKPNPTGREDHEA